MDSEFRSGDKLESTSQHGSSGPRNLPLEYLRKITNNFSDVIGGGGFGMVYKGVLPNDEMIAVKKFHSSLLPGVQDKQFENEACHLTRLKHPNIVLLVGWCSETEIIPIEYNGKQVCAEKLERLLCLEYMPKGNLRGYLSDESSGLTWETRYKIIKGICYGLHYLHEESQLNAPIIHMDLKPENILLDNNMEPKIADFGLSRLFSEKRTKAFTISCDGTLGYMAPEYIKRGMISKNSDIFSLGVIIIEIVTGARDYPDETGGISSQEFTELVLKSWRNRLQNPLRYTSLEIDYQQIRRCIQIGLDCVKLDRSKRPTISQVIKMLQETESAVQSHLTLIDDNQVMPHGFGVAPEAMPLELLKQSTNNFSEEQKLDSGTSVTGFYKLVKMFFNHSEKCTNLVVHDSELPNRRARSSSDENVSMDAMSLSMDDNVSMDAMSMSMDATSMSMDAMSMSMDDNVSMDAMSLSMDAMSLQSDEDGYKPRGNQVQAEWVERYEPGIYITLTTLRDGTRDLKRVRFSRRRFVEHQAENWWSENHEKVYERYNVKRPERVSTGG